MEPMAVSYLKLCSIEDLLLLQKISYHTYKETFKNYTTEKIMQDYLEEAFDLKKLEIELTNINSAFYFLYVDEKLAGYIKVNHDKAQSDIHDPQSLELERIYILKEMQGKGYGQILLDKAIDIAKQENKEYLWLGVWEKNINAISFYQKNGFYISGAHSFFMGEDEQTDHIMRKNLK